jgi:hypothetical protein
LVIPNFRNISSSLETTISNLDTFGSGEKGAHSFNGSPPTFRLSELAESLPETNCIAPTRLLAFGCNFGNKSNNFFILNFDFSALAAGTKCFSKAWVPGLLECVHFTSQLLAGEWAIDAHRLLDGRGSK